MRKAIIYFFSILILIAAVLFLTFFIKNWGGLRPVLLSPPADIAKLIDRANKNASSTVKQPPAAVNETGLPLKLPAGFKISVFAQDLGKARVMAYDPAGRLIVSLTDVGRVVALVDENFDGQVDRTETILEGLNRPHGLAFRCEADAPPSQCKMYVAESDAVATYDFNRADGTVSNRKEIISLPGGGNHYTRTIMFMPYPNDDKLLISVGSSCNVCLETDNRRAKILIADSGGANLRVFATGLRNSVFMAIHPVSGEIWASEMGRDFLGDNLPPDEVNIIQAGKNYGWPICYGQNIHDTDFDRNTYVRNPCQEPSEIPSYFDLPAHSAPLGLAFFPEEGWPEDYWYNLLVAYHGSWNRSEPTGYKIVRFRLDAQGNFLDKDENGRPKEIDFITGWLTADGTALGRPVDILIQPGGVIYVSDDKAGAIYRLTYTPQGAAKGPSDLIFVDQPQPNQAAESPLLISGRARGSWYFEASFPIKLYDSSGALLAESYAQANPPAGGDWMTEDYVPFKLSLAYKQPATRGGILVLEKDNPSGLPENAAEVRIPIIFSNGLSSDCVVGGCSGQICSESDADGLISTCEYKEEYACYRTAKCERQANGVCGWTETGELLECLEKAKGQ